jgi:hypothetical protein
MKIVLRLDFATASAIGAGEARVGHSKSYGSSFGLEVHLGELSSIWSRVICLALPLSAAPSLECRAPGDS